MSQKIIGLTIFTIFTYNIILTNGCWEKFKNSEDLTNASDTCFLKLGLTEDDLPSGIEEWKSPEFDDKCHSKCVMIELKEIIDNKNINLENIMKTLEMNAPTNIQNKLKPLVKECYTQYEKEIQKTDPKDECKIDKTFMACYFTQSEKFC